MSESGIFQKILRLDPGNTDPEAAGSAGYSPAVSTPGQGCPWGLAHPCKCLQD